jgi:uncharacterized protein with ACT and thioredoxin-like domain
MDEIISFFIEHHPGRTEDVSSVLTDMQNIIAEYEELISYIDKYLISQNLIIYLFIARGLFR